MIIPPHLQIPFQPVAQAGAVIIASHVRFTILTSRLIRLEYSPSDTFEDRPSQVVWFRHQPVPAFSHEEVNGRLTLTTEHLRLHCQIGQAWDTPDALTITLLENNHTWHIGDPNPQNLLGTTRTLDGVSGNTILEPGLLSRGGWHLLDDSHTLVFNSQSWLTPRDTTNQDLYFFGYGQAYAQALQDYSQIAGPVPLIPRWVLGNWWSRYWAYTQEELQDLMTQFRAHEVPLAVCIVDMDWHITDTKRNYGGWTGYTWNKDLFPNPTGFIEWLHSQGLRTGLNLHPAQGVGPHEEMYPAMAERMGIDPATEEHVRFDIANPEFANAYFELLHHPEEARGVDFWWMDWQQGKKSALEGLDPLWWLNHLHFYDLGRTKAQRPFIFSRWGGLGNHRYPIGFSGDTHVDWPTLAFQPYFTATAANVGYGWWSHDIGGHMFGIEEPELYARWVQFGLFSPILRLHSTRNPFHDRRPWGHGDEVFAISREAMQMRHALIPYLYSMAWHNTITSQSLVRPLYHDYPNEEAAYACPQEYLFGTELLAAPFTSPADPDTRLSRQVVWLPQGNWYNFFTGEHLRGDSWHAVYGRLADIPVFAKAGAIVPLAPKVGWGGLDNPTQLDVHIFAGADGQFTLYEDDGQTTAYQRGGSVLTQLSQTWQSQQMTVQIKPNGRFDIRASHLLPEQRNWVLHIYGLTEPQKITVQIGGATAVSHTAVTGTYDPHRECLTLPMLTLPTSDSLTVTLLAPKGGWLAQRDRTLEKCQDMLAVFRLESMTKWGISERLGELIDNPALLSDYLALPQSQARALLEVSQEVGVHHITNMHHKNLLILWNNQQKEGFRYQFQQETHQWDLRQRFVSNDETLPRFKAIVPKHRWQFKAHYLDLVQIVYS